MAHLSPTALSILSMQVVTILKSTDIVTWHSFEYSALEPILSSDKRNLGFEVRCLRWFRTVNLLLDWFYPESSSSRFLLFRSHLIPQSPLGCRVWQSRRQQNWNIFSLLGSPRCKVLYDLSHSDNSSHLNSLYVSNWCKSPPSEYFLKDKHHILVHK